MRLLIQRKAHIIFHGLFNDNSTAKINKNVTEKFNGQNEHDHRKLAKTRPTHQIKKNNQTIDNEQTNKISNLKD